MVGGESRKETRFGPLLLSLTCTSLKNSIDFIILNNSSSPHMLGKQFALLPVQERRTHAPIGLCRARGPRLNVFPIQSRPLENPGVSKISRGSSLLGTLTLRGASHSGHPRPTWVVLDGRFKPYGAASPLFVQSKSNHTAAIQEEALCLHLDLCK